MIVLRFIVISVLGREMKGKIALVMELNIKIVLIVQKNVILIVNI